MRSEGAFTLRAIVAGVALLVVGFSAGFYARPPIQGWVTGLKASIAHNARVRRLSDAYLGKLAPAFDAPTVDGSHFRIRDEKGKVVLLFFWASWCDHCRNAIPALKAIASRYADRDDFRIVGISLDRKREALVDYAARADIPWVNVYEDGKGFNGTVPRAYRVSTIPSRWIIDKDNCVRGIDLDNQATEKTLALLLDGAQDATAR